MRDVESAMEKMLVAERPALHRFRWLMLVLVGILLGDLIGYYYAMQKLDGYRDMALGSSDSLRKQIVQLTDETASSRKLLDSLRIENGTLNTKLIAAEKRATDNADAAKKAYQWRDERDEAKSASAGMQRSINDIEEKLKDDDVSGALKVINKLKGK